jgi:ribosomal subunit interface protein
MILNIKSTNLDLTPAIKEYIEMRVGPLERYLGKTELGSDVIARVEISRTTRHHGKGDVYRAEINIDVGKNIARVERIGEDVRAMIDEVVEALKQVLVKYKEKKSDH